jgi:amino acid adenylation domain-containing protein
MPETFRLSPQQSFQLSRPGGPAASQCVIVVADQPVRERLSEIVARHEALRTTFPTPPGARAPVAQAVHDELEPVWVQANEGELETLLAREAEKVDLEHGPSLRALLVGGLLILTASAACADSVSLLQIARELNGTPAQGDPIQHADYAEWRHELRSGEDPDATEGRSFWSQDGRREVLLFGKHETSGQRARVALEVDADVDVELVEAVWHAVLARLSGLTELCTLRLSDGRSDPELAGAIGPYAQPVPIRLRVETETQLPELLDRVRRARAEAERWQDYAAEADLARVAEQALAGFCPQPSHDDDVVFVSPGSTGCAIELVWLGTGRLELTYDEASYDRADVEDIAAALRSALVAHQTQVVRAIPIADTAARARMLGLASGPPLSGGPEPVHRQFERQAERTPDLPAVRGENQSLTYAELDERANRLAHHLVAQGITSGEPVGLCLPRSPAMLTALLGIMKAGGAYLPLNFAHPPARLAHQLKQSAARVVVTQSRLIDHLPEVEVVCIDHDHGEDATHPPQVDGDLAYVMYTSGSTGTPKGVAVTHANLAAYTAAISAQLEPAPGMQFALVSEISTDLGNTAIFPALVRGGCVHLIDPQASMDGTALADYARQHPLDVIKITPSHLRALLAADAGFLPRRWLIGGGEALSWELVERVRATSAACRILNHYGPTETTIGCCTYVVPAAPTAAASVPIGRPLPGARAYVLDDQLEPVPIGVPGELYVGGAGVARGYVNRPEETAARFVADPQGGRMYRTGDRARRHRDGTIEFLGRLDHQVKVRGYRVEPGEIEGVLLSHPAVREAAVVVQDAQQDARLVAYFVASGQPSQADLQAFLAQSLPEYMVPSRWVPLPTLPLTPSGKVDRLALPDPATFDSDRRENFVAPRDEVERQIAEIWAQLLGLDKVGVLDDFFALGGHSLLATQAIMRIRRIYGNIPLGALFNSPTVAALAEVIRERNAA